MKNECYHENILKNQDLYTCKYCKKIIPIIFLKKVSLEEFKEKYPPVTENESLPIFFDKLI